MKAIDAVRIPIKNMAVIEERIRIPIPFFIGSSPFLYGKTVSHYQTRFRWYAAWLLSYFPP